MTDSSEIRGQGLKDGDRIERGIKGDLICGLE